MIRKKIATLVLAAVTTLAASATAFAQEVTYSFPVGAKQVRIAGTDIALDVPVHTFKDGQVWVPLRAVAQALGGKVEWDGDKRQAHVYGPQNQHFILTVDSTDVKILAGGGQSPLSGPVHVVNGRVEVPLAFLAANFGYSFKYDEASKTASIAQDPAKRVLMVYGPGGPFGPMNELAQKFAQAKGVEVKVVAGPEGNWLTQAKADADLYFGGAEYMLIDFDQRNPGLVDGSTRTSLYSRALGVLVRKGNPLGIKTVEDLAKDGVKLLDVNGAGQVGAWEDLAGPDLIPAIRKNIAVSVRNTADGIKAWNSNPDLNAWIIYESWHYRLKDVTDLVQLPEHQKLYRGIPIAIAKTTDQRELAQQFIDYLKSDEGHDVFKKWGWK